MTALWLCVAAALPLGGTSDNSAYNAYHSKYVDTDTASSKLGVLANSAIEAGSMLFGGGAEPAEETAFASPELPEDADFGGFDGIKYTEYTLQLEPGDKVFLYTDGVPEATNKDLELFGTDRMIEALNVHPELSPRGILGSVHRAVDIFVASSEQFDDLTMLCLEYRGPVKK